MKPHNDNFSNERDLLYGIANSYLADTHQASRWPIYALITAALLLAAGAGTYLAYGYYRNQNACHIKGNITPARERVYYVPNHPTYEMVKIEPNQGELLFCSEREAIKAGWRRAALPYTP
jgi:hypothetical protein